MTEMQKAGWFHSVVVTNHPDKEKRKPTLFNAMLRATKVPRAQHVDESVQASHNLRKAWTATQVADHLRHRKCDILQEEERSRRKPEEPSVRAAGGGTDIAGRIQQEEGDDSRSGQAYQVALERTRLLGELRAEIWRGS